MPPPRREHRRQAAERVADDRELHIALPVGGVARLRLVGADVLRRSVDGVPGVADAGNLYARPAGPRDVHENQFVVVVDHAGLSTIFSPFTATTLYRLSRPHALISDILPSCSTTITAGHHASTGQSRGISKLEPSVSMVSTSAPPPSCASIVFTVTCGTQ